MFYGLAIEARHEGKKGSLVDFTAGWKGGASGGYMRDDAITNANAIWENDYNAQLATYNKEYGAFESAKQNYINQHQNLYPSSGNPLQDSTYATISRRPLPVAPTVPGYPNDQVRINRSWGSIVSSLEYSRVVSGKNTKRKVRAGASLNFTDPIYSRFKGGALNVDLAKEYQPWLMGRFFIRF